MTANLLSVHSPEHLPELQAEAHEKPDLHIAKNTQTEQEPDSLQFLF